MQEGLPAKEFASIPIPVIYKIKLDYDNKGKAVGFHYCNLNSLIESLAGRFEEQPENKYLLELASKDYWLDEFDKVVKTAQTTHLKDEFFKCGGWFDVYAWKIADCQVAVVLTDVTQRKVAEESLRRQAELIELSPDGIIIEILDGVITFWSHGAENMYGWTKKEAVGQKACELLKTRYPESPEYIFDYLKAYGKWSGELIHKTKDGQDINVQSRWLARLNSNNKLEILKSNVDITKIKKIQTEQEITIGFLKIANEAKSTRELVEKVIGFFFKQSGCEAIGIRLKRGDDFPYYETKGFSNEHLLLENTLCAKDEKGEIQRDSDGNPIIECMCGNIICGRFNPLMDFFTEKGSFWTNSTTKLLASTSEEDRQARTRNRCNGEGYESVALIPLRFGDKRLGLLQLNDKRKEKFTLETIQLWERIADHLALALARTFAEEKNSGVQ
jgi:PAS domain S-box-containing protein